MKKPKARGSDGKWLEKDVADFCAIYERDGVATIRKVDPPTRIIGKGTIIQLANPFLDFVGAWTAQNGRMIVAEAKSTADGNFALTGNTDLKDHQFESLLRWRSFGAAVCVLWGYRGEVRYVSLALVEARIANGIKHMLWAHAEKIEPGLGFLRYDWLRNLAADESLHGS